MTEFNRKLSDEILNRIILLNAMMERDVNALKGVYDQRELNYVVGKAHEGYKRFVENMTYLLKKYDEKELAEQLKVILKDDSVDELALGFAYLVDLSDEKKKIATQFLQEFRDNKVTFVPDEEVTA